MSIALWLQGLWQDSKDAARSLRHRPWFTTGVVLILALSSGLVTAAFSLAYGVFLRPWPVPDPNSIVVLYSRPATAKADYPEISIAEFRYLDGLAQTFEHLALVDRAQRTSASVRGADVGELHPLYVSRGYLDLIRTRYAAGRGFAVDEHDYLRPVAVAVLSNRTWRRVFNADPTVVGQTIQLGRQTYTIIGVASAASFVEMYSDDYDLALPLEALALGGAEGDQRAFTDPRQRRSRITVAGRLATGAEPSQAMAELTTLSRQFRDSHQLPAVDVLHVTTRRVSWPGDRPEWPATQLAFLGLLLMHLLACANAGNLLLARGIARQRELAIRQSLGAGRGRIVRQLLAETLALSATAGLLALIVAWFVPPIVAREVQAFATDWRHVNGPVLGFNVVLAGLTVLVTGLAPALRSTGRWVALRWPGSQTPPPGALRLRRVLLAAQVALATVLLVSAGLLGRAVNRAASADPGFAIKEITVVDLKLPRLGDFKRALQFFQDLRASLVTSGLSTVALAVAAPLSDITAVAPVRRMDEPSGNARPFRRMDVSENYFDVIGSPLVAGRPPSTLGPSEAVVSLRAARELWPGGENPIGQQLRHGWLGREVDILTVVGVAQDVAINSLVEREPAVYLAGTYTPSLLVRDSSPATIARVQSAVNALVTGAIMTSHPMTEHIQRSLAASSMMSRIVWGVSGLALLLATIGTFGVFACAVEERRREVGIRMALGAGRGDIVSAIWATPRRAILVGLAVGLALGQVGARLFARFLHGLSPLDPLTYAEIAAVLFIAAVLATWIPARRASSVDPAATLRAE
jgi:putative ABC transport system permease protein